MQIKALITHLVVKPSLAVIILVLIASTIVNLNLSKWKKRNVIDWDVISYYSYLPAYFIEDDIDLNFFKKNSDYYATQKRMYFPLKCPNGNLIIKTTMGMSVMYLPFFTVGHLWAKTFGYEANGFSEPYQCMIQFSGLFYLLVGLWFLRKVLLQFFKEIITAITLLCMVFGTHLFFYGSVHGAMAHATDFMLASVFIFYSIKWLNQPDYKTTIVLGLVSGMLVLIRPVNILFFLFFVLYEVTSFNDLTDRFKLYAKHYKKLLLIALLAFLCFLPQMLYWKHITGQYLFNSYVGEQFYFSKPHLLEGLFGFRKGWLLYAPMMVFSLIGIGILFKKYKDFAWPLLLLVGVYVYVVLSWWCWWYGGSWGLRAMIDVYPFLAISFAVFVKWLLGSTRQIKRTGIYTLVFLVVWNLFQTLQYRWGIIHFDGMTKEAYFDALFRIEKSPDLEKLINRPDYDKALDGEE